MKLIQHTFIDAYHMLQWTIRGVLEKDTLICERGMLSFQEFCELLLNTAIVKN